MTALPSDTVNVSSSSSRASPRIGTLKVCVSGSPGANVSAPDVAV